MIGSPLVHEHAVELNMAGRTPIGTTKLPVEGLGEVTGYEYADGVRQYCGIPYATLSKRWTRSELCTKWEKDRHDGTRLGSVGL